MLQHLIISVTEKQTTPIEIITTHEEIKVPTSLCVFANVRSRRTKGAGAVIKFVNTNIMLIARTVNRQVYKIKNVIVINPLRMRRRVTVVCLCVCVCVSVCYRSSCSSVDLYCPTSIVTESPYFKGF